MVRAYAVTARTEAGRMREESTLDSNEYVILARGMDPGVRVVTGRTSDVIDAVEQFANYPWQWLRDGAAPPRVWAVVTGTDQSDFGLTEIHPAVWNRGTPSEPWWVCEWSDPDGTRRSFPIKA